MSPLEICCEFIERNRVRFECISLVILQPDEGIWSASVTIDYDTIDEIACGEGDSAQAAISDLARKLEARKD